MDHSGSTDQFDGADTIFLNSSFNVEDKIRISRTKCYLDAHLGRFSLGYCIVIVLFAVIRHSTQKKLHVLSDIFPFALKWGNRGSGTKIFPVTYFYKQPHFRVEPEFLRIEFPKRRLKVAKKLLSIFIIQAQCCSILGHFRLKCQENRQN